MSHSDLARILLALLCGLQGVGTLAIDLNRTHAANPLWPKHARFHLVWQAISYTFLSFLEIALVVMKGPLLDARFYLAGVLASVPMLSFLAAFIFRDVYGGSVINPNGIPPLRIVSHGSVLLVDLSLVVEAVALVLLFGILVLFRN